MLFIVIHGTFPLKGGGKETVLLLRDAEGVGLETDCKDKLGKAGEQWVKQPLVPEGHAG